MELSVRQNEILKIIKEEQPVRSQYLADRLGISQATVRTDLSILSSMKLIEGKPNQGYTYLGNTLNIGIDNAIKVADVIKPAVTVFETDSVYDAALKLILKDVSSLFVLNKKNNLVGIISRKDLLKSTIQGSDPRVIPCGLVMTRQPLYKVTTEDSVYDATVLMVDKQIDCLPVVRIEEGNDILLGRITKTSVSEVYVKIFK